MDHNEIMLLCHNIVKQDASKFFRLNGISIDYSIGASMEFFVRTGNITINPYLLEKQYLKYNSTFSYNKFVSIVFYHELGHLLDYWKEESFEKLKNMNECYLEIERNPFNISSQLKEIYFHELVNSELRAWEQSDNLVPTDLKHEYEIVKSDSINKVEENQRNFIELIIEGFRNRIH